MMKKAILHKMIAVIAAAAMMLAVSCAMAQGAVIDNGSDPASMLNLREQPDRNAKVLGRFFSGTQVEIIADAGGGWSQITIGVKPGMVSGFVMTEYLDGASPVNATRSAAVASPYGTQSVVLRDRPSNSYNAVAMLMVGDSVIVIGEMNEFRYVQTGSGCVGCLLESELK